MTFLLQPGIKRLTTASNSIKFYSQEQLHPYQAHKKLQNSTICISQQYGTYYETNSRFLSSPPGKGKFPEQFFFENLFSLQQIGRGGENYEVSVKVMTGSLIGSVIRFCCSKSKELPPNLLLNFYLGFWVYSKIYKSVLY